MRQSGNDEFDKAEKLLQPKMVAFRLKADWETATPMYERAATAFRNTREFGRAQVAYERAATGHQRQGSPWQSGKALEKAADMAKQGKQSGPAVEALYRDAARAYMEAGRTQVAAEALARAAQHLEGLDAKASSQLYIDAVGALEEDGKESTASDLYRQAIGGELRMGKFGEAVSLLLRFAVACQGLQLRSSLCKCYLGAVVVWLYAEAAAQAWAVYQDAMEVELFASSDEAFAAEALFQAYRSGHAEEVKQCVASTHAFLELDNQVVRLAKRLPQGDVAEMARALGTTGATMTDGAAEEGEEDLT